VCAALREGGAGVCAEEIPLPFGNDGGTGETWDGGKHWSQKATISAQQFYDVAVDNELPYNVMGGTQDNGAWLGPSQNRNSYGVFAADWKYLPTGDGFYVDSSDNNVFLNNRAESNGFGAYGGFGMELLYASSTLSEITLC
jgi:hypothetical protein